jgi:vancomycin aglycone glucosyltransferase
MDLREYTDMRVLLAPCGTRGDVQPVIALAVGLRARGHDVSFVAPSNFLEWIRAHGFAVESMDVDFEELLRGGGPDINSSRWQFRQFQKFIPQLFTSVARASEHADLIVGAGVQVAAPSVAEWREVPCVSVTFCPCAIPGGTAPPPMVQRQTWPAWVNRLLWHVGLPVADLALRGGINRGRAALGLAPIDRPLADLFGRHVILAADRDLGPLDEADAGHVFCSDAWILDEPAVLDARVEAFLALDPAPVYVGFGSMMARRVPELAAQAVAAVRSLGRGAIIAGGWASLDRYLVEADDILTIGALPHHAVFPRVAAVVHHGGAGTTTAAARAGVPQVILPHVLDQYYWGHRIEQLGLGPRAVPVDLITADILSDRIDAAIGDTRIRERAAAAGRAIGPRNGVASAVTYLEQLVAAEKTTA